ncbi:MAG: NFACT RNA binding domain-containing protein [Cyclobacteriaceae bacterium]
MQNNFYFLRQLSAALNEKISGYAIVSCFSQNKDELVIELNNSKSSFFIKANLSASFSCLSFPNEFHRARKNSVDLFGEIILKKVKSLRQFENERAFSMELGDHLSLVFKMHGNVSNVLLVKGNKVKEIFKNQLQSDFEIDVDRLDKEIDFTRENFSRNIDHLNATYFTFGKVVFEYLKERNFNSLSDETKWKLFVETIELLKTPKFYVAEKSDRLILSLLPVGKSEREFDEPMLALNFFVEKNVRDEVFYSEKRTALNFVDTQLKNVKNYIEKNSRKLNEIQQDQHYQLWADLIMANLHLIKTGDEKVSLTSFYDGKLVEIKLKRELTPQKNAEVFYRKFKNRQIEIEKLREGISRKQNEESRLFSAIKGIEEAEDLKTVRQVTNEYDLRKRTQEQIEVLPYREFEFKGYKIWVGKNAESNDTLTLKYSFKEDLWLHAKDVAGSHVLLKHHAGKNFPKDVIEYAASLAAFYSKRKNEKLCPVAFTPKKFVRKRKGDPAGAVVVEREEVILVEPFKGVVS